jgi:CRP-like cAMP-binding protein
MDPTRPSTRAYLGGNAILECLSASEREDLLPELGVYSEDEATVLRSHDQPIDVVHFPIDSVYSVVVELAGGNAYEVGVVGRFGLIGGEIALGAHSSWRTVLCQAAGSVTQLPADRFRNALDRSPVFRGAVYNALRREWFDSLQTVACNFAHSVEQRAARWILMTQDQIGYQHFPMRFEFLSIMLGVTGQKILQPMKLLEELGCIRYADGQLTVLSRELLLSNACECYLQQQRSTAFTSTGGIS